MGLPQQGPAAVRTPPPAGRIATLATIALALGFLLGSATPLLAATQPKKTRRSPYTATTSRAARQSALKSIPFDKLDPDARAKVQSVLRNASFFRRMPIRVVDCDPSMYLFLVRNPDVVVNIWDVLNLSTMKLWRIGPNCYRVAESAGTLADIQFLYSSHDTHVIYGEGSYNGPLFARPAKGRCLMVLRTGYVRETDGRYYITSRLDTFVSVDDEGVELLAKAIQPLMGKTADLNFVQTVGFFGSLSRTAEVNSRGVQRLASRLTNVQPEARRRLAELAVEVSQKTAASDVQKSDNPTQVASRPTPKGRG